MAKKKNNTIRTRGKPPFNAYDAEFQKSRWAGTFRDVHFGTAAVHQKMVALFKCEGALWLMETDKGYRTFAYNSSPQGDGEGPWQGCSWTDIGMWDRSICTQVPQDEYHVLFVNTETGHYEWRMDCMTVNRITHTMTAKPASPIQIIDNQGDQWLCNWKADKWYNRRDKIDAKRQGKPLTKIYDAVYIFWSKGCQGIPTINPLI